MNATGVLQAARVYRNAGINLLAIKAGGSKAPAPECLVHGGWKYLQSRRVTDKELVTFFSNGNGVAAIGGAVSGHLEAIDFDDLETYQTWRHLVSEQLGAEFLQRLLLVQTLIETKAEGGYFLLPGCPPSCHETGRLYDLLQGSFQNIPVIAAEERETMLSCARSLSLIAREEYQPQKSSRTRSNGLLPGDDFNARGPSWANLLPRYGFRFHSQQGETTYWTRPGRDRGRSASTNHGGHDCFYAFSTSLPFDIDRGYRRFAVYAILEHDGNFSAAASTLAREGYGKQSSRAARAVRDDGSDEERKAIQAEAIESERESRTAYRIVTPKESFITKYVAYASQRTDAPLEAHELMAAGTLSALAGPKPRIPMATSIKGWALCLWVLYIVNSTIGRKSSVVDYSSDIIEQVLGQEAILHWEGSPQGIVQRLQKRDAQSAVFIRDEYSGLLAQMNRGGHMAGLAQTFIRAYDGRPLENVRTNKKDKDTGRQVEDTDIVREPYLVKLCASTRDSFISKATIDNVLDGFLPRFITYTGSSEPRRMQRATKELVSLRDGLIRHAQEVHYKAQHLDEIDIDDSVLERAWTLEQHWAIERAMSCSRPEAAGAALKRLADSVLKVAALLAIDSAAKGEIPRVDTTHFEQAKLMGVRWVDSTVALIDALGRTDFQQDCDAVLTTVKASRKGIKLSALYRKHRRLKKRDFDQILEALKDQEEIIIPDSEDKIIGRPALMIFYNRRES